MLPDDLKVVPAGTPTFPAAGSGYPHAPGDAKQPTPCDGGGGAVVVVPVVVAVVVVAYVVVAVVVVGAGVVVVVPPPPVRTVPYIDQ